MLDSVHNILIHQHNHKYKPFLSVFQKFVQLSCNPKFEAFFDDQVWN